MKFSEQKTLHLLLADDDEDDRALFREAFREIGDHTQVKTVDGHKALFKHLVDSDSLPDIIFLDINMPGKDGIECLRDLKNHKKYCEIPVVIYTTSSAKELIEQAFDLGAHAFISKPSTFTKIVKVLREVLSADWAKKPNRKNFVKDVR